MGISATNSMKSQVGQQKGKITLAVDGSTIAEAYLRRVQLSWDKPAYRYKKDGQYEAFPWSKVHNTVLGLYKSFRSLGIEPGDKVALMSHTRLEWALCDLGIICSGAVTVPIYPSSTPDDIAHILAHCEAKLIFVDELPHVKKVFESLEKLGKTIPIVTFSENLKTVDGQTPHYLGDFAKYEKDESIEEAFEKTVRKIAPDDMASIVYTSGTTGQPKGAILTHHNFASGVRGVAEAVDVDSSDMLLSFLPYSHILGRIEVTAPIFWDIGLGFAENITTVAQNMQELRPTVLISVPRIYEKIYAKILSEVEAGGPFKLKIFRWAENIGRKVARHRSLKTSIPMGLALKYRIADRLVLSKIRAKLGGRIKLTASGGAPLSQTLCEFFHGCGIKILEGYGLTETLGPIFVNQPENYRFGTVGLPIGDAEVKIAEDGEILLRGSCVFKGYYKSPNETRDALTEDGWFHTGDIGDLDERGFLRITDRKKELIVTAGGKNIAPQKLENLIKLSAYISNCMTYGDKQKYIVGLVTLDEANIRQWAKANGLNTSDPSALATDPKVTKLIDQEIGIANKSLASFETIKKFRIVPQDFSVESGELTPSLKIKRKVISEKYRDVIEQMYQ